MRKLKRRHPRSLPSRLVLIVAGALMLSGRFRPASESPFNSLF